MVYFLFFLCHSDGVWDPEKWHASLYPSENDPTGDDRPSLKRRIAGNFVYFLVAIYFDSDLECGF